MRARIELKGCHSYSRGGTIYRKGQSRIITGDREIAYFKSVPAFDVTMLEDEPKKAAPAPAPTASSEDTGDEKPARSTRSRRSRTSGEG